MRRLLLFAIVAILGFSSCKKTENNYYGEERKDPSTVEVVKPTTGENYNGITTEFIVAHNWTIVEIGKQIGNNGKPGMWKLQESKGSNNWVIIDPAPDELYWNPDYKKGFTIWGLEVSKMKRYTPK